MYLATIALVALGPTTSTAQQPVGLAGEALPGPAFPASQLGTSETPVNAPNLNEGQTSAFAPMSPLSGVQVLAPTLEGSSRNYWAPALSCTQYATTNPNGLNRDSGLFSESSCAGKLTLQKVDRHSQLNLDFTSGGFDYSRPYATGAKQYGIAGELAVFEQVSGRRWNWTAGNQGSYLPEGSVGYEPFAGLSTFAGGMGESAMSSAPALNSAFSPNQSIYSGVARRFSDLALSEFRFDAGPKTSLTASVMLGTQQFLAPGFLDNLSWSVIGGCNRTFGRGNEVALTYDEMHYSFSADQQGFSAHGASILYGHPINRKLTVELSVAPMAREAGSTTHFFLGTYDSLGYRARRWDGTLRFDRTLTGGAGVLAGAERTQVMAMFGRQLSRRVHGSLNMAYADNLSLTQGSPAASRPSYNYVQAGANLTHELGRHISMYLDYSVQRQTSNTPLCEGATCSTLYFRQVAGFGVNWHAQPMKIH